MPKDKQGNKLTYKEFLSRWKKGIEGITPMQQVKVQIKSTWIMIFGLLAGIVISVVGISRLWWLMLILVGGLGNASVQIISLYQKKKTFEKWEGLE